MLYSHYHKIESTPRFVQRLYLASSPLPCPIWYTTRLVPCLMYLNHVSDTGFRKLYFHAVSNCSKHKTAVLSKFWHTYCDELSGGSEQLCVAPLLQLCCNIYSRQ